MTEFWMELQAVDSYQVKASGILTGADRKIITMLYQPLMGAECLALYQTLFTEVEENRLWSEAHSHVQLLNMLDISLKALFEARLKLEGLGLLKSYVKTENDQRFYIYEILPPLSPEKFFSDGLLNIYLYSKIGNAQFQRLRRFFADEVFDTATYSEITRSFQDVFEPFKGGSSAVTTETSQKLLDKVTPKEIEFDDASFDFNLFLSLLSPGMIAREKITKEVRQTILKLHGIYQVSEKDMPSYLYRALDANGEIDIVYLRKIVREGYTIEHGAPPKLQMKQEAPVDKEPEETLNDEEALQVYLESITPFQLLVDISDGAVPAETDLRVVEEVMNQQNLPVPVMNVLIEYVLLRLDRKLSKNYMMTIAAHWKRKNVKTAKEAMDLAWQEHEKYKRLQEEPATPKTNNYNRNYQKSTRKEILPDWFDKEQVAPAENKMTDKEKQTLEEQVREIKERLNKR
ncbi:TPA: helicase DnaB [Listeria monocytogenes]|uniref:replication initiation and membrane attachment family protein n=1 Tax=Listeria monocytogenes TaxID=1639 RepID=UPI0010B3B42A|nr:replication initiation and membrane attachment family protein [Listeria monocytogenes]EAC8325849.1 helicase DnaB [Listeria monocytogenes]EAC8329118.1 helicase DnaB [Listeria monocytogenes]EAC8634600.1 helicase DnaB [Listeria monocytogenes]ECB9822417.1 helicase DnaB [Listeria monocytogenes]HAO5812826.1 helicase DnaB [Listeria monocytogenes]